MARKLNAVTFVRGHMYRPGDEVAPEHLDRIGDHLWTDGEPDVQPAGMRGVGDPVPPPVDRLGGQDPEQARDPATGDGVEPGTGSTPAAEPETPAPPQEQPVAPPRSGRGSGLDAWRSYAEKLGIEVSDDADRDDVIAAVDAHRLSQREAQK